MGRPRENLAARTCCHGRTSGENSKNSPMRCHRTSERRRQDNLCYAGIVEFVNPDLMAEGLSPFPPREAAIRARRLVLLEIHRLVSGPRRFRRRKHPQRPKLPLPVAALEEYLATASSSSTSPAIRGMASHRSAGPAGRARSAACGCASSIRTELEEKYSLLDGNRPMRQPKVSAENQRSFEFVKRAGPPGAENRTQARYGYRHLAGGKNRSRETVSREPHSPISAVT